MGEKGWIPQAFPPFLPDSPFLPDTPFLLLTTQQDCATDPQSDQGLGREPRLPCECPAQGGDALSVEALC